MTKSLEDKLLELLDLVKIDNRKNQEQRESMIEILGRVNTDIQILKLKVDNIEEDFHEMKIDVKNLQQQVYNNSNMIIKDK